MHARDFVKSYIEAWNRHDAQAIADHLAENGRYLDIPIHQNLSRAELIEHLKELFAEDDYIYELHGEVLAGESTIAFQYEVHPRSLERKRLEKKGLEAEDLKEKILEEETWYGAEFITLSNGRAVEISDYYEQGGQNGTGSPLSGGAASGVVKRYAKSGLSSEQMANLKSGINHLMADEQIYLRPDLTLPELAGALNRSVNHVSQAINAGFGMSFFDYLNEFRVRDAMQLLVDKESEKTILSIALEVGFNSTSTFYVAFKKVTGKTPAQFRKSQRR